MSARVVSVDPAEVEGVISTLRDSGHVATHLGIEVTQGMPAMTPTLEYELYHELRNVGLQLEKLGRELFLDAAAQEVRLVLFGAADSGAAGRAASTLLGDIAGQQAELMVADAGRTGMEAVMQPIDRAEHFGEGAYDFGKGIAETLWLVERSTNEYGLADPVGHMRALQQDVRIAQTMFKTSIPYLLWNPRESLRTDALLAYGAVGGQYIWEGDTDKWLGFAAPQALLTVLTGGEAEAAVAPAEAAAAMAETAGAASGAARISRLAASADEGDLVSLALRPRVMPGDTGLVVPHTGIGVLDHLSDAFSALVTVNTAPDQLPLETNTQ